MFTISTINSGTAAQDYLELYITTSSNHEFLSSRNIALFARISLITPINSASRDFETPSSSSPDTRAVGETEIANKEGEALVPTNRGGFESEGSKIERNVERVKIRTGRTVHLDGWEGRSLDYRAKSESSPRRLSVALRGTRSIVASARCGHGEYLYGVVVPGYPGGRRGHRAKALLTPPPCRRRAPHLDEAYIP